MTKAEIAQIVRSMPLPPSRYGTCMRRALHGLTVLREHGIAATAQIGAMIWRDLDGRELRYCNARGMPAFNIGISVNAHYWLVSGDQLIDFSCGNWPIKPPFKYLWADAKQFGGPPYPQPGKAWFGNAAPIDLEAVAAKIGQPQQRRPS